MDKTTKKTGQLESMTETTARGVTIDPVGLADQVSKARAALRESNPQCFVDQPERCVAVTSAEQDLAAVEAKLRELVAGPGLGESASVEPEDERDTAR